MATCISSLLAILGKSEQQGQSHKFLYQNFIKPLSINNSFVASIASVGDKTQYTNSSSAAFLTFGQHIAQQNNSGVMLVWFIQNTTEPQMRLQIVCTCLLGFWFHAAMASEPVPAAKQLLQQAEQYRGLPNSYVLNGRIETLRDGVQDKMQPYQLLAGTDRRSLVIFTEGVNQGQKVLMQDQQFWLQLPGSRRPLRITPLQKLLGEASSGDVASLSWLQDYQATLASEQADPATVVLELSAARDGLSYQRIRLYLATADKFPHYAEFYVASGKLAKQATFVRGQLNGQDRVVAMQLTDNLQSKTKTVLHYDSIEAKELPGRLFNPQALSTLQAL